MDTNHELITMKMKAKLSTLWIFVLFNVLFRDIHEFVKPGYLEQVMAGTTNGPQVTDQLLLLAGVILEIPILMVILSRVLKYRFNRWANIGAGALTIAFTLGNAATGTPDLDDIFFATIEVVGLSLIIWSAWRWRKQQPESIPAVT